MQRRESVCRGCVSVVEAIKVSEEAVRVLIKAVIVPIKHSHGLNNTLTVVRKFR